MELLKIVYLIYLHFPVVSDHYNRFENIVVLKDYPNNVCCRNCGSIMGKLNRKLSEVTLFSFRIMRVAPYEFSQTCCMSEDIIDHSHHFSLWSKIMNVTDSYRISPIYNYYCRARRLSSPCKYSPGPRVLFQNNPSNKKEVEDSHVSDAIESVYDVSLTDTDIAIVAESSDLQPTIRDAVTTEIIDDGIITPQHESVGCDNFAYQTSYQYTASNFDIDINNSSYNDVEPVYIARKPSIQNSECDASEVIYKNLEPIASASSYKNTESTVNTLSCSDFEPIASTSSYHNLEPVASALSYHNLEPVAKSKVDCVDEFFNDSSNYTFANFDQKMDNILRSCLYGDDQLNFDMPVIILISFFTN